MLIPPVPEYDLSPEARRLLGPDYEPDLLLHDFLWKNLNLILPWIFNALDEGQQIAAMHDADDAWRRWLRANPQRAEAYGRGEVDGGR